MTQTSLAGSAPQTRLSARSGAAAEPPLILMTVDAVGGVWRYAMELARALSARRYRFVFAVLGPKPSRDQETEARRLGAVVWVGQPLDWMVDAPERLSAVGPALADLAAEHRADLLHLNAPSHATGLVASLPIVTVTHSCLPTWWKSVKGDALPAGWRWHLRINREGFDLSDSVVAPSASHARATDECYGCNRIEVVYNGIAVSPRRGPRDQMLFAVGRWWDEGKNGKVLGLAGPNIPWPLIVAGSSEGPSGQRLDMAGVRAIGAVSHDDVLDTMRRAEIVVSPSIYEPFGLAPLEGARSGAALLLADNPTYRELWDGAAVFFEASDANALAAGARRLIDDPETRKGFAAKALARSLHFTTDRQADAMDKIYRRHLRRPAVLPEEKN